MAAKRRAGAPTPLMKRKVVSRGRKVFKARKSDRLRGKIRVGFLLGKDNDPVAVGAHPRDMPKKYRQEGGLGWGGSYHADAVAAWNVGKQYPELKVDLIREEDCSLARLKQNDINYVLGADLISGMIKDPEKGAKSAHYKMVRKALESPQANCFPAWPLQNWVYMKEKYMKQFAKAGIPVLPTIFLRKYPDPVKLLRDIRARGWKRFVIKPYPSCWSIGFLDAHTQDCVRDPSLLRKHFGTDPCEAYLVQEFLESPEFPGQSFSEIRSYWIDGHYSHSALTTAEDESQGIDGITLPPPKQDLRKVVALGRRVMNEVMKQCSFHGKKTAPAIVRIDIGIVAKGFIVRGSGWNSRKRTYFLNEVENMVANWLTRYVANDAKGLKGKRYRKMQPVDVCGRMTETLAKKAHELCGGKPWKLSWLPHRWHGQEASASGAQGARSGKAKRKLPAGAQNPRTGRGQRRASVTRRRGKRRLGA